MDELLAKLTAAQQQAVTHIDGPLLVLAGPGSGKTRVITHRVAHLIHQGIRPYNILAITFTNKAADEMRQRIAAFNLPRGSTICTFHSLAARLLREFHEKADLPADFSIYDDADQRSAVRDATKKIELDPQNFPPAQMLNQISACKNDLESPEQFAARRTDFRGQKIALIYSAYQKQLKQNGALDFDDLLMKLALLLRDSELRDLLNQRFRYVLVDEYQDTNHCQYQIARGLALNHRNLCATGDPDQSIYGWRGADIGNILAFEQDYPDAKIVRLEENFRSTPQVLDLADQLIRANKKRKIKKLFTSLPPGSPCELAEFEDEYDEARGMTDWLQSLKEQNLEYRQMAVFYRVNSMSRPLEEALRRATIPYQIVRGVEFFQRKEIKDMIAYLRLLINLSDQVALKRVINRPTRGIGQTTIGRIFDHANSSGKDLWQILNNIDQVPTLANAARTRVKKFVAIIADLQKNLNQPVRQIVQTTYKKTGMESLLKADKNEDPHDNVCELVNSAAQYDNDSEAPSLAEYLQQIALVSDSDAYDAESGSVSLMTLHAAKGLEFPAVLIIGVEHGLIPHARSLDSEDSLEEERRLLFVGITRAQQKLRLSFARRRTNQGASLTTIRSEFLRTLQGLDFQQSLSPYEDFNDADEFQDEFQPIRRNNYQSHHRPHQWNNSPKKSKKRRPTSIDDSQTSTSTRSDINLQPNQLVRHPKFGLGRVKSISSDREHCFVVIQFNTGARKTLDLQYAKLDILD
ncbi:MAG: UvrD-helicase domain-containing protein [Sedimentisphaerales bacterium]|nr:UvrD-helicase domain-containing protein [Sedimentisphaerales bacterium]